MSKAKVDGISKHWSGTVSSDEVCFIPSAIKKTKAAVLENDATRARIFSTELHPQIALANKDQQANLDDPCNRAKRSEGNLRFDCHGGKTLLLNDVAANGQHATVAFI